MTQTINKLYTILDHEFDINELKDIVNHGMSAGVSGFIYTHECCDAFDKFEDGIEEYLSDWYHDNMGEKDYIGVIASGVDTMGNRPVCSINSLKTRMVWCYVELKAHEILCSVDTNL
tara:strand:+ start:371 stop:721 length:351 start_codon:yes stop_codon:yes gene_type:complete